MSLLLVGFLAALRMVAKQLNWSQFDRNLHIGTIGPQRGMMQCESQFAFSRPASLKQQAEVVMIASMAPTNLCLARSP